MKAHFFISTIGISETNRKRGIQYLAFYNLQDTLFQLALFKYPQVMQEKDGERHFRRCLRTLSVLKWRYCRLIKTLKVKSGTAAYKR